MNNNFLYTFLLAFIFIFSACGSNEKQDGPQSGSTGSSSAIGNIQSSLQSIKIDQNSGNINANIDLTSNYPSNTIVNLNEMAISFGGCLLQSGSTFFSPNSVLLDNVTTTKTVQVSATLLDSSCIPRSYIVKGTNNLDTNGKTETKQFQTNSVNIDKNIIKLEKLSLIKLEVLDKQIDINETGVTKPITVRVTKQGLGLRDQGIKIISNISDGSFSSLTSTSDVGGDAIFEYTAPTTINNKSFGVEFCLESDMSICDNLEISLVSGEIVEHQEPVDNINYFITFVPNGGANNLALGSRNNAIVTLVDKDTKKAIPNNRIKSIRVISRDETILKLTPEGGGTPDKLIQFGENRNAVAVLLTADRINSGLAVLEVFVEYTNLNGEQKTRGQLFTVAVLSGEPTAFSINNAGVGYNFETKQFEQKYIVQATDLTGNPVATTGVINVSAMASFAKDNGGREILYGRHSGGISATLTPINNKASLELVGLNPFGSSSIKLNRAFVAVFGDVETYEANGKWSIGNIVSGNTINLNNEYHGISHSGLGMAIGYNFRDKICTSTYEESVVVVDSTDGTYLLNEKGQAFVTLKYDSYMIGKRAMVLVNMSGLNPNTGKSIRTGEVRETTLSFNKPLKGDTIPIPAGTANMRVTIFGTIDTGTDDEWGVYNSTFSCAIKLNNAVIESGPNKNDINDCTDNGRAYLSYVVSSTGEDGSITFEKCQVDNEPKF